MGSGGLLSMLLALASAPSARSFSDLCREPQSDDVAGRQITLAHGSNGWTVDYSATEGAVDAPIPARRVRYYPRTGRLSFEVVTWERMRFAGRVAGHALWGEVTYDEGRRSRIRLAEVTGETPYPACR